MSKDWKEKLLMASQTPEFKAVVVKTAGKSSDAKRVAAAVAIDKGRDLHAEKARELFGLSATAKVTQEQRDAGKNANYFKLYGDKTVKASGAAPVRSATKAEIVLSSINSAGKSASAIGVLKSVRSVELKERLTDVASLCRKVHVLVSEQAAVTKGLVPTRRLVETAMNYVKSVESGIASNDVTTDMLPEISQTMRGHLRTLRSSVETTLAPPKPQPTFEQLDAKAVERFKLAEAGFNREVGKNRDKAAFIVDIPVIPIFDGVVVPERLAAVGLPVSGLGGYPVMLRQRIICINTDIADKLKHDKATYLTRLIERIEEHSSHKWELVTPSGMANKKHELMMYWIMPQKALNSMTDAAGSSLREWGLAF